MEDVASFYERLARKEQYPTVDSQFSDVHSSVVIIPRVTNIRKTMSIKPSPSRSVGQEPRRLNTTRHQGPEAPVCGQGTRVSGGGAWRRRGKTSAESRSCPWAESVARRNTLQGRGWGNENKTPQCSLPAATPRQMLAVEHILMFYLRWTIRCQWGVEEEYVVGISQLTRSALCFIRWELHRPGLISGLLLPLILHILDVTIVIWCLMWTFFYYKFSLKVHTDE